MSGEEPRWHRAEVFLHKEHLVLMMSGKNGWIRYNLAWWRWTKPWFRQPRKVWVSTHGIISDPIVYLITGELFKLPCDLRTAAEIASELEASRDQQRASAVRGNAQDAAN
jgi:hypothetical protein